jgi:hypothetical protein
MSHDGHESKGTRFRSVSHDLIAGRIFVVEPLCCIGSCGSEAIAPFVVVLALPNRSGARARLQEPAKGSQTDTLTGNCGFRK